METNNLLVFGQLLVITLVVCRILYDKWAKARQFAFFKNFVEYSTSDKICRIIQYISSGVNTSATFSNLNLKVITSQQNLYQLQALMSVTRKIIRIIRAPINIMAIINRKNIINKKNKFTIAKSISQVCKLLSDISDGIFYYTDHFTFLLNMGILYSNQLQTMLQFIGHIMWIVGSVFIIISATIELQLGKIQVTNFSQTKQYKLLWLDIYMNILQFLLGFTFIYPTIVCRQVISTMVIIASIIRLLKYGVK